MLIYFFIRLYGRRRVDILSELWEQDKSHLTLRELFKFISKDDAKTMRQVSRQWRKIVSHCATKSPPGSPRSLPRQVDDKENETAAPFKHLFKDTHDAPTPKPLQIRRPSVVQPSFMVRPPQGPCLNPRVQELWEVGEKF